MKLDLSTCSAASAWGATLYAALLPFHALGSVPARRWTRLEPCDLVLLLFAPAILIELVRMHRRLRGSWIIRGVALLVAFGALSELLSPRPSGLVALEEALAILAVASVSMAVWSGHGRQMLRGALLGGAVALAIAVAGYVATLSGLVAGGAFVFSSDHPVFPNLPRMTGTLGRHAVWLGEYGVMLLALALAADDRVGSRALRTFAAIAAALGLLASMSFAWLGGVVLAMGGLLARVPNTRRSPAGIALALALLALYMVASFWMIIGLPVDPSAHSASKPCRQLDGAHHVLRRGPAPGICQPILADEPYPHRLTLYALAHQTAWRRFKAHPVIGAGGSSYDDFARAHAASTHALGNAGYYHEPVGLVAATLANTGLAGALALTLILYGVWQARSRSTELLDDNSIGQPPAPELMPGARRWLFYGTLGLLLAATQTDLELRGPLWLLLGLLAAGPERLGTNVTP